MTVNSLKEIRFHGRGGQGVVTAAEIIALAAFYEDAYGQSFPFFGPERRGSPVISYVRIDENRIRLRMGIYAPDCVLVLDPQLPRLVNVTDGLKEGGIVVINSRNGQQEGVLTGKTGKLAFVDATGIALEVMGRPVTNTVMLGAFSAATGWLGIGSIIRGIERKLPASIAKKNVEAASVAYESTRVHEVS